MSKAWWAALALFASVAWSAPPGPLPPQDDKELGRAIFKEWVEIRTTHDVGTTLAARAIEQHLLKAGFPAEDVVFIAPADHPDKGNVVVRYRGKGRGPAVLFLGHLDVVEAKTEDWSVELCGDVDFRWSCGECLAATGASRDPVPDDAR